MRAAAQPGSAATRLTRTRVPSEPICVARLQATGSASRSWSLGRRPALAVRCRSSGWSSARLEGRLWERNWERNGALVGALVGAQSGRAPLSWGVRGQSLVSRSGSRAGRAPGLDPVRFLAVIALCSRRVGRASRSGDRDPCPGRSEGRGAPGMTSHTDGVRASVGSSRLQALNGVGCDCASS